MKKRKAAIIGAGSTYTPELMEGFIERRDSLKFNEFYLVDIDERKLNIVGSLAQRMLEYAGYDCKIILTSDLEEALDGADYVFAQIRVGGLKARIKDEKIPLKYGLLGQETTGIGGFFKALRTVPVMVDIAKKMEKLCPDAYLVNFSNPSGIVAQAVSDYTNIQSVGLCNCPVNMAASIEKELGDASFDYTYVGLNHLSWITSVKHGGEDKVAQLSAVSAGQMKNVPKIKYEKLLEEAIPAIPSSYLSYFYMREAQIEKCKKAEKTRGEICMEIEETLLKKYEDTHVKEKPAELEERGGALYSTAAVSFVDAIENGRNEYHVLNVQNQNCLPYMAESDVVEVKCLVGKKSIRPVKIEKDIHPYIKGLMQSVKAYEKLTVKAALEGSRAAALAALMIHPLIGDYVKAKEAMEEMLTANKAYLPLFFKE